MNFVPRQFQGANKEKLNQAVATKNAQSQDHASFGQLRTLVGNVVCQSSILERFEHAGDSTWGDIQSFC